MSTGMVMSSNGSLRCLRPVLLEAHQQSKGRSYKAASRTHMARMAASRTHMAHMAASCTHMAHMAASCSLPFKLCQLLITPTAMAIAMHRNRGKLIPSAVHCVSLLGDRCFASCVQTLSCLFDRDCLCAGMPGSMVPPEQRWSVLQPTAYTATCGKHQSAEC